MSYPCSTTSSAATGRTSTWPLQRIEEYELRESPFWDSRSSTAPTISARVRISSWSSDSSARGTRSGCMTRVSCFPSLVGANREHLVRTLRTSPRTWWMTWTKRFDGADSSSWLRATRPTRTSSNGLEPRTEGPGSSWSRRVAGAGSTVPRVPLVNARRPASPDRRAHPGAEPARALSTGGCGRKPARCVTPASTSASSVPSSEQHPALQEELDGIQFTAIDLVWRHGGLPATSSSTGLRSAR